MVARFLSVAVVVCAVLGSALPAVGATPLITSGLKGYWSFDADSAVDDKGSGTAYDGTWNGTPVYSADVPIGFTGKSADMRASNTAIYVQTDFNGSTYDNSVFNLDRISIAFWTKGQHPQSDWGWWACKDGDTNGYRVTQPGGPGTKKMMWGMRGGPGDTAQVSVGPIDDTKWWHYVVTYDGSTKKIYQDGVLLTSSGAGGNISDSTSALVFGATDTNAAGLTLDKFAKIRMDEIYVFDRGISASEVIKLYGASAWDGGVGNWGDSKWSGGQAPVTGRNMAIDAASADSNVALAADFSAQSLILGATAASALTINSTKTLTLAGPANVGASGTLQVNGTLTTPAISIATGGSATVGASGTLTATSLTTGGSFSVASGGTLNATTVQFNPGNTTTGTFNASGGYAAGFLNNIPGNVTIAANLAGAGGMALPTWGVGLAILTGTNTYSGTTGGNWQQYLRANEGVGLSPNTNLMIFSESGFETGVNLVRPGGSAGGEMRLNSTAFGAGFTAVGGPVKVCFGSLATPTPLTWNDGNYFKIDGDQFTDNRLRGLFLNGGYADVGKNNATHPIEFVNPINLGTISGANWGRCISVVSTTQPATMSGVLSGDRGIKKMQPGELILTNANTYTGNTQVEQGKLTISSTGSLLMDINSVGSSTQLLGTGTLQLDGGLRLNVADVTGAGSWNLVNVGTLNESYGGSFWIGMDGGSTFSNASGVWTSGTGWTFTQSTGMLEYVATTNHLSTWNVTGGGSWGTTSNWDLGVPETVNDTATFGPGKPGPGAEVTLDALRIVKALTFDNSNQVTVKPGTGGTLKLQGASPVPVEVATGDHLISAPVELGDSARVTVKSGQKLTISGDITMSGTTQTLTLGLDSSDTGTLVLSGSTNDYASTTVNYGTLQINKAGALPAGKALTIGAGGTVVLSSGLTNAAATNAATSATAVPEPGTIALLAAGLAGMLVAAWRRRR